MKGSTAHVVLAGVVGAIVAILGQLALGMLFPPAEPEIVTTTATTEKDRYEENQYQSELTVQDLVEVLGLTVWKARVNDHPDQPVTSMKLFLKQAGQEPKEQMSLHLDGPGVVRLALSRVNGNKIKYTATFNADSARDGQTQAASSAVSGAFVDPIETQTRGTNTGANIGLPGKIILQDTGRIQTHGDLSSEDEMQAIYLLVE